MNFLDNVIILGLIAGAFFVGKYISDKYHAKIESEYSYFIRLNEARFAARDGVGYIAPVMREPVQVADDQFMDRLKKNGRATKQINRT